MDERTVERLSSVALHLAQFIELSPVEQEWLLPILGRAEKRAISIIECIYGRYMTYAEIAQATGSNVNTVKQTIYALAEGGLNFQSDNAGRWFLKSTGRKRKLSRFNK